MTATIPQHIVVTGHPKLPDALQEAEAIATYLEQKGLEVCCGSL